MKERFIIENENCFALSVKKAKRYAMKDTNQLDYTVKIRNLKDEAKDEDEESGIDDWVLPVRNEQIANFWDLD